MKGGWSAPFSKVVHESWARHAEKVESAKIAAAVRSNLTQTRIGKRSETMGKSLLDLKPGDKIVVNGRKGYVFQGIDDGHGVTDYYVKYAKPGEEYYGYIVSYLVRPQLDEIGEANLTLKNAENDLIRARQQYEGAVEAYNKAYDAYAAAVLKEQGIERIST